MDGAFQCRSAAVHLKGLKAVAFRHDLVNAEHFADRAQGSLSFVGSRSTVARIFLRYVQRTEKTTWEGTLANADDAREK